MRTIRRGAAIAGLFGLGVLTATDMASARSEHRLLTVHRHHRSRAVPHRFVFPTPQAARENLESAAIGPTSSIDDFGIPGATTADPYQRPAVGYDITGRYGPGYAYPD